MEQQVQVSEAVGRVADVIEKYGWLQGHYGTQDTGFCVVGADIAQSGLVSWAHGLSDVLTAIAEGLPTLSVMPCDCARCKVILWNDTTGRTKEEVIAHLRMVEQREREREALTPVEEVKTESVETEVIETLVSNMLAQVDAFLVKPLTSTTAPPEAPEPEESEPERVLVPV